MHQIISSQIFISKRAEHEINNGSGGFNIRMLYHSGRLKSCKYKFLYKFFKWNSVLQAYRNSYRKAVQHAAHRSALLSHINEDFSQSSITIFSCSQEKRLPVNLCFLCKASSFCR